MNTLVPNLTRRAFVGGLALGVLATDAVATCPADPLAVCNVTHLYSVTSARIVEVRSADDKSLGAARFSNALWDKYSV